MADGADEHGDIARPDHQEEDTRQTTPKKKTPPPSPDIPVRVDAKLTYDSVAALDRFARTVLATKLP